MLLDVRNLQTTFLTAQGAVKAVGGIDFTIDRGETLALVGESGCGKSVTALSLLRLVPEPGRIVAGELFFDGVDLRTLPEEAMRQVRGNRIAMIFQEPMTSLNPVLPISEQIGEVLRLHRGMTREAARAEAMALLTRVGIPAPGQRIDDYPHQLSGGMRQRVMIAMALACHPALLIADEPTTALDVTIQAQIMELLRTLRDESGMALLLITHDLGVVAEVADRVAIMYAGLIMEYAPVLALYAAPSHPYTRGLLACIPRLGEKKSRMATISGQVPGAGATVVGCPFAERCPEIFAPCHDRLPPLVELTPGHFVRCWKACHATAP
ncbi:MAG: dipeptide/oligopeptide/nickel ABC transporter ATP-binding protein [Desulfuromonadales bacterium GWD2_61_12]|nr:MAG: dipeptide/oligopeptide/nickel ABC transporter ATP-binding protein [Desulfuromonadales bacterium GWD2_61_12]HAD03397.1 ABC transporter ATP-binding protein [Desulfuromonas sp.]